MEPVDYLKILKNHWKVVVALVVLAVVAVWFTSPKSASKAFAAEHKILLVQAAGGRDGGGSSNSNPQVVAFYVDAPEVPQRVAERIGFDGDPQSLSGRVDSLVDPEVGTITVTATAPTKQEAIDLANAFGEELVTYVDEVEEARVQQEVADNTVIADRIRGEINQLNTQLSSTTDPVIQGQIEDELDNKYQELANFTAVEDASANRTKYQSMVIATSAEEQAGFIAGIGREQRALLAAVAGALAGFGVAIMLDRSDSRLRSKDQVERRFGLPVLAEVPLLALRDRSRAAVVAFEREPRVAEAYRGLRTALALFRSRMESDRMASVTNGNGNSNGRAAIGSNPTPSGSSRQLVVVTSPEAGDGKSTTAANLAMAHAEAGQSVLLVSWDLWRPLSPGVFDAQEGPGVADYLEGHGGSLVRYVQDTSIPGVRIVTAGLGGHHPYTQIENARRLLEEARTLAQVVIVDTAPILSASVTRELVTLADAVVIVCRSGRTTGPAADRCAELLERLGAPTLGVVLVGVPTGPFADYYGAPPKESRVAGRATFRRRSEDAAPGGRHKAPTGGQSLRPTSAQYRASTQRTSGRVEPYE